MATFSPVILLEANMTTP